MPVLTPKEIRLAVRARRDKRGEAAEKYLAAQFNTEGADARELAYLTIFRALYWREKELGSEAAPAEAFVKDLLLHYSFWPLELKDIRGAELGEDGEVLEQRWHDRETVIRAVHEEAEEVATLRAMTVERYGSRCGFEAHGCSSKSRD